jgi:hypothetical protein
MLVTGGRKGLLYSALLVTIFFLLHDLARAQALPGGLKILPQDAEMFAIPGETTVNGFPSRLFGFRSWRKPSDVADVYVQSWGAPITRQVAAGAIILGKMVSDAFITVKLSPIASGGTQGILSVMNLRVGADERARLLKEAEVWRQRIGTDAKLVDSSYSTDENSESFLFVIASGSSVEDVARRATQYLQVQGFLLEREIRDDANKVDIGVRRESSLVRLFKRSDGAEAHATIHGLNRSITYSTINIVTKK